MSATSPEELTVGCTVHVKRYGRAIVLSSLQKDPSQPFHNRIEVQYPDGKKYWARAATLRRIVTPPKRIVVAETTRQYREAAMTYVAPDDICLEVGCHEGVTTAMLHQRCHFIVGVDLSDKTIAMARSKYPDIASSFEAIDGFNIDALQALSPNGAFDKVLIDIGGIAELPTVLKMVGLYYKTWPSAALIIKSVFFARMVEDVQVYMPSAACLSSAAEGAAAHRQQTRQKRAEERHCRDAVEAGDG